MQRVDEERYVLKSGRILTIENNTLSITPDGHLVDGFKNLFANPTEFTEDERVEIGLYMVKKWARFIDSDYIQIFYKNLKEIPQSYYNPPLPQSVLGFESNLRKE